MADRNYLQDAGSQATAAGRQLTKAATVDTATAAGQRTKRRLLTEAQANLNAALARIDSALHELEREAQEM